MEPTRWIDYDYAIVRLVPHVHDAMFLNIGVLLLARSEDYLGCAFAAERERIQAFAPEIDYDLLVRYLDAMRYVCDGGHHGGAIGALPASERFHWLTAPRSAVLQTSAVHPGRCGDPSAVLSLLLARHCLTGAGARG